MDETPFQIDTRGEFSFPENHKFDAGFGLTEATIDYICDAKGEPAVRVVTMKKPD